MLANIAKLFYFSYSSPEIPANAFYAAIILPGQGSAGKLPTDPRRRTQCRKIHHQGTVGKDPRLSAGKNNPLIHADQIQSKHLTTEQQEDPRRSAGKTAMTHASQMHKRTHCIGIPEKIGANLRKNSPDPPGSNT